MRALAMLAAAAWQLACACAAGGQGLAYCNVTAVQTQRLVNAVQVTIRADGALQTDFDPADFFNVQALSEGRDDFQKQLTVLPIRIRNARSRIGSFADVGVYPVSHAEVSIPPNAVEGIGLDVRLVLFVPAAVRSVKMGHSEWNIGGTSGQGPVASIEMAPDQRSIIILVTRDRRLLAPAVKRSAPPGAPRELEVLPSAGGNVTIHALNAALGPLVSELARQARRPIVMDDAATHTVSLCLEDVTVDEALDGLAAAYNLTVARDGPVTRLGEGTASSIAAYGEGAYESIRLKHLSAVSARGILPEFMLRYVHVDESRNALTAFGPRTLVDKLRQDLEKVDRPLPQIEVEAEMVEFSSSDDLAAVLGQRGQDRANQLEVLPDAGDITYRYVGGLPRSYEADLHALEARGRARIRSRARVVALNGQTARLFAGQQRYIKATYFDMWNGGYDTRIFAVDVGANLEITPWTGGGGEITARVVPEVSDVAELDGATGLPVVATRRAETSVRVRDGETVVIGGLSLQQPETSWRKVPVLGDLPLIGWLFRSPRRRHVRTELAVFITPRIVTGRAVTPPRDAVLPPGVLPLSRLSVLSLAPLPPSLPVRAKGE